MALISTAAAERSLIVLMELCLFKETKSKVFSIAELKISEVITKPMHPIRVIHSNLEI